MPRSRSFLSLAPLLSVLLAACSRESTPAPGLDPTATVGSSLGTSPRPRSVSGARFVEADASSEPVADVVRRERTRVEATGGRLLVAVGAPWCEPCRRFHTAVTEGKLDAVLPGLVFLEFDHDRDEERLRAAGYVSRLIPLYALPDRDGRASPDPATRIEGSIKGDGAVAEITPRLLRLIAGASTSP